MRQNIVFSYSERIPVSFSWLFHDFSFFFNVILRYYCFLQKLFYYYYFIIYFLSWKLFLFFHVPGCSGMSRHVPECSGIFHVPGFIDGRKKGRFTVKSIYYINTNEIPGGLSGENISSHVKITCYFHMWKYHRCYGYIINCAFRRVKLFQWNGLVVHWCLYNK